jgi:lysyl-tRNA synthetase class 2
MSHGLKSRAVLQEQERISCREPRLRLRALMVQAIRAFFIGEGYLEVETPVLMAAPAPELHISAVPAGGGFLQTSPELFMKRLLAAGYGKIFQLCRCFREGERGKLHVPEFTMLEWYRCHAGYQDIMSECEAMLRATARAIGLGEEICYQGKRIDLSCPWERITVQEAFERYSSLEIDRAMEEDRFDACMVEEIEPRLGSPKPTFLYDYPSSMAALARVKERDPRFAERFELYLGGIELANAFSELSDPDEQRSRFQQEMIKREKLGRDVYPLPEKFLAALTLMPEAAGIALGIDRLAMILSDSPDIDDVIAFTPEER